MRICYVVAALGDFIVYRKSPAANLKGFMYFSLLKDTGRHLKCVGIQAKLIDKAERTVMHECLKILWNKAWCNGYFMR